MWCVGVQCGVWCVMCSVWCVVCSVVCGVWCTHIGRVVVHACVCGCRVRVYACIDLHTIFILPAPDVIDMDAVLFGFEEELTAAVQVITQIHQAHVNIHLFRCPRARAHTHTHTRTHTYLTRILLPRAWWFEPA
jgi:ABC-type arginine transport system permease subunit